MQKYPDIREYLIYHGLHLIWSGLINVINKVWSGLIVLITVWTGYDIVWYYYMT